MLESCPISSSRVDSHLVRIVAVEIFLLAILLLWTHALVFAFFLLYDFSVRFLNLKKWSILGRLGQVIIGYFKLKPKFCDEAPKRFALYLGLGIIVLFTLLFLLDLPFMASILVVVLLLCSSLEALFDYCIGCKIYFVVELLRQRH